MKNKDFIPYQESLELKKLGFDEPCFFAFDNCSTPMRCSDLRTNEQKFNGVNYNSSSYTSQPSYPQAFRWFREKHNIVFYVNMVRCDNFYFVIHLKIDDNFNPEDLFISEHFKNHEEAELDCLKKLIEIIKQGGNK